MRECPECGGLVVECDDTEDYNLNPVTSLYCPGCGWSDEEENDGDESETCLMCGGLENNHKSGCSDDDNLWY